MGFIMITADLVEEVSQSLYSASLRRVPPDTLRALEAARSNEESASARATLDLMLRSANVAGTIARVGCRVSGEPTYLLETGGAARWQGGLKAAPARGFAHLVETNQPRLRKHANSPLTNDRGGMGKDMPAITVGLP